MRINSKISQYISTIEKITYTKDYSLIYSNHEVYCYVDFSIEEQTKNMVYLEDIGFSCYAKKINSSDDPFSLFLVKKTSNTNLDTLYDLYEKSRSKNEWTEEDFDRIYHDLLIQYDSLFQNYFMLQDKIEEMYYPTESFFLLLIHMSDIYRLLSLGRFFLEQWRAMHVYQYQEVYTLENILPSNFVLGNVIDVSHGKRNMAIIELSHYYHIYYYQDYLIEDISSFLEQFSLDKSEKYLFYAKLAIIKMIDGRNMLDVKSLLYYVQITYQFLLEKYQKYQKTNNNEFQE